MNTFGYLETKFLILHFSNEVLSEELIGRLKTITQQNKWSFECANIVKAKKENDKYNSILALICNSSNQPRS